MVSGAIGEYGHRAVRPAVVEINRDIEYADGRCLEVSSVSVMGRRSASVMSSHVQVRSYEGLGNIRAMGHCSTRHWLANYGTTLL